MTAKTIELSHFYPEKAEAVWRVATDWTCLQKAMEGLVRYYGLPDTPIVEGMIVETEFSLFGILPKMPWKMEVLTFDPVNRCIKSHEEGGVVTRWDHHFEVVEAEGGSVLRESITIDAGGMTWLYVFWGKFMYGRRHPARLEMLKGES